MNCSTLGVAARAASAGRRRPRRRTRPLLLPSSGRAVSLFLLSHSCRLLLCLTVDDCDTLKTLPDGTDGFTSLEGLIIEECPGIEKFPQGLLQRLPALKLLEIKACPNLQKRCRHGGEYFDLISCIPDKYIPAAESKMKKFVKKFLPSC